MNAGGYALGGTFLILLIVIGIIILVIVFLWIMVPFILLDMKKQFEEIINLLSEQNENLPSRKNRRPIK